MLPYSSINNGKMISKVFGLLIVAAAVTSGNGMTTTILDDETITFPTNELISKTLTIPKSTFDILQSCHVIMPNGAMDEAFPNNQLDDPYISFLEAVEPFRSCAIGFLGAPITHSGTYELYSVVKDWMSSKLTLTRKRFHLTLKEIDP